MRWPWSKKQPEPTEFELEVERLLAPPSRWRRWEAEVLASTSPEKRHAVRNLLMGLPADTP